MILFRWRFVSFVAGALVVTLGGGVPCVGLAADPPAEFNDLYGELSVHLDRFETSLERSGAVDSSVSLGNNLVSGNSHRGLDLINPDPRYYEGILMELDRLRDMGTGTVKIEISFPMLYEPYHRDWRGQSSEYQQFLDFYKRLASDIRSRGLKFIVQSSILFSEGHWTDFSVRPFYDSLTNAEYVGARSSVINTIARELQPDFLLVQAEPDTESIQTGKAFINNPNNSGLMIRYFLDQLRTQTSFTGQVASGFGSWQSSYELWVDTLTAIPGLDPIDIHVYPVNLDFLDRLFTIADRVKASGKTLAIGEA